MVPNSTLAPRTPTITHCQLTVNLIEANGLLNLPSQWTTLDTIYISQCKEGVRVLVFLATILYGTLAFFMEVKERT